MTGWIRRDVCRDARRPVLRRVWVLAGRGGTRDADHGIITGSSRAFGRQTCSMHACMHSWIHTYAYMQVLGMEFSKAYDDWKERKKLEQQTEKLLKKRNLLMKGLEAQRSGLGEAASRAGHQDAKGEQVTGLSVDAEGLSAVDFTEDELSKGEKKRMIVDMQLAMNASEAGMSEDRIQQCIGPEARMQVRRCVKDCALKSTHHSTLLSNP